MASPVPGLSQSRVDNPRRCIFDVFESAIDKFLFVAETLINPRWREMVHPADSADTVTTNGEEHLIKRQG